MPREFGRQCVRTQKRGAHRDAKHLAQSTGHAQLFSLVFQAQAIARFDLDGTNPFGQQSLQTGHGGMEQIVLARVACGLDAGHNAAPGTRHLFVAGPGQAHGKFMGPLATVDQMRVAVDQAGRDPGAVTVV